jgi:hypothetical protein
MFGQEGLQVTELNAFRVQELRHGTTGHNRQVTTEKHAIKTRKYAGNLGMWMVSQNRAKLADTAQ